MAARDMVMRSRVWHRAVQCEEIFGVLVEARQYLGLKFH
jgi:hypothetical protein